MLDVEDKYLSQAHEDIGKCLIEYWSQEMYLFHSAGISLDLFFPRL